MSVALLIGTPLKRHAYFSGGVPAAATDIVTLSLTKAVWECGPLKIAACFPRAVKGLFHQAGSDLAIESTEVLNMRTETPAQIIEGLLAGCEKTRGQTNLSPTSNVEVGCESVLGTDPSVPVFFRNLLEEER